MKKKIFSVLLVLAMVIAMMPMTVFATSEQIGDYMFDKDTGTITDYTGAGGDLEIPATLDGVAVTEIGYGAFWEKNITSIVIPASVTSIDVYAFNNCVNITRVTFAEGSKLSSIGASAFNCCVNIESISIPASVTSLGSGVFYGCDNLKSITMKSATPPSGVDGNTFNYCHNNLKIYVPAASVETYRSAWSQYTDKIVAFHDLKVTKNDEAAEEGADYTWDSDRPEKLCILSSDLTVSGTTTSEYIEVNVGVTDLTIKDLSISLEGDGRRCLDFKSPDENVVVTNAVTLTLVGNNKLTTADGFVVYFEGENTKVINGEGNLEASCSGFELGNTGSGILSEGKLIFNQSGTVTASGKNGGINAYDTIMFNNDIGRILAYGLQRAVVSSVDIEHGENLSIKGSTEFKANEASITSDTTIREGQVWIGEEAAKSVLIQPKQYDVTVSSEIKNGKVKVDKEKAAKDETVTLTVTPDENYKLASLTVTDADGKEVTVTDNKFEMPASNVTVTAKFEKIEIIKGNDQKVKAGSKEEVTFTSSAPFSTFKKVLVDGKEITKDKDYTVKEGSTIVTLKPEYVATLKAGEHKVEIVSEGGTATGKLTITDTPKTADANNMLLWIVIALATISLTIYTVLKVKRTNK